MNKDASNSLIILNHYFSTMIFYYDSARYIRFIKNKNWYTLSKKHACCVQKIYKGKFSRAFYGIIYERNDIQGY